MAQIVINISNDTYYRCKNERVGLLPFDIPEVCDAIKNGTALSKGQFIAICDSDYPITEKVKNILKETAFVGGDEEEEDMYCFDIKEIIEADKEEKK